MSLIAGTLGALQRLLDEAGLSWGVCSGAAAHLYGVRRPINNVDILLPPGHLYQVRNLLQKNRWMAQYDGQILLWRGVKLFDDLPVTIAGRRCPFLLDSLMQEYLRRLPLLGSRVLVLAPEDVLVQKALLVGAGDTSPQHRGDFEAIARVQGTSLDLAYVARRLGLCRAREELEPLFTEIGLVLP